MPSVEGLVIISAATSGVTSSRSLSTSIWPVRFGLDVLDFVAGDHRGGGIRAVRGIGNQNFLARIALLLEVRADQQQARQFALRARRRLQRDGVHAR